MKLAEAVTAFRAAFAGGDYHAAFRAVIAASGKASDRERDAAIRALLDPSIDHPEVAGFACVASGAIVEDGGSPLAGIDTILDWLADGAEHIAGAGPALADADLDATDRAPPTALAADTRRWIAAFKSHVRGAMARFARAVEARNRARAHPRLGPAIAAVAERTRSRHLYYIVEVLAMLDDDLIDVVELAGDGRVSRYRAFAIRSGFHLMTVLDLQDPHAIARKRAEFVSLRHGYHPWTALVEAAGTWAASPSDVILGELRAADLPRYEGVRTVLRAEPMPSRSFGASLIAPIHEALREALVPEGGTSPADARPYLQQMAAAARSAIESRPE